MCVYALLCSHKAQSVGVHFYRRNRGFVEVNIEARCEFEKLYDTFNVFNGLIVIFNKWKDVICKEKMSQILFFIDTFPFDFVTYLKKFKQPAKVVHQ